MRRCPAILALALVALVSANCQLIGLPGGTFDPTRPVPYPDGCAAYGFSQRRCDAIVEWAKAQLPAGHGAIAAIELAPDSQPHITLSTSFTALVRFRMVDGSSLDFPLYCGIGGRFSILCADNPEIRISSPTMGGYRDVPCTGEAPEGCSTPLPTLESSAAAAARPLTIAVRDVPIDHAGKFEIPLGQAVLPNGILTEASFSLRDRLTQALSIDGAVWLDVRPVDPNGRPFDNYYMHGWREGTETVDAVMVFEVVSFEPGATLELRDIVVR